MILKRFSPALTIPVFLTVLSVYGMTQLQAGSSNKSGNPFGNGTFFSDNGSFSSIVRGTNGFLGVVQFTTSSTNSSTNSLTNSGIATIYAQGEQFSGAAFGSVSGSTVASTYLGSYTYDVLVPTVNYDTNGNISSTTYAPTTVTDTASGQFSATLFNTYPTQSFSGEGEATIIQNILNPTNFILSSVNTSYSNTVAGSRLVQ